VQIPLLDLSAQYAAIREAVDEAVARVVASQRFVLGEEVEALEAALAERIGVRHAIGCSSGTDALWLILKALDLGADDEVIVPAFTFFATAGAVWNAGLRPVFCDVDPATFNVTVETLERAAGPRTRAVIAVHLFGQMAPMEDVVAWARERGVAVIEDAAQAIDAERTPAGGGAPLRAGAAGDAGAFSFFPTKNLGGFGDGGLVTTDDDVLAERVRKLRVHGGKQMYHHEMVGTNARLDALQAAVLRAKLPHLDAWTAARRAHAAIYDRALADVPEVLPPAVLPGNTHVYNQYTLRARRRDELRTALEAAGIGTGVYYPAPLHLQPCFAALGQGRGSLPAAEALCAEVLSLPVYPELGGGRAERVAEAIRAFYG